MNRLFDLADRVAIVTGILGRLGPIWAEALLEAGAIVVGIDRPAVEPSVRYKGLVDRFGEDHVRLLRADVCDRAAIAQACRQCLKDFGTPHILVNNAGIDHPPRTGTTWRLEDLPVELSRQIFEVNVLGLFQVTQVFGTEMVKAGRGSIINIGSLYASVSPDHRLYAHLPCDPPFLKAPAYGASKAAVVNLTKYFTTLWAPSGIRVNVLSPGGVLGEQDPEFRRKFCERVPMGRMAVEADLKGPLVFLASDASSYVTGVDLKVDGGFVAW